MSILNSFLPKLADCSTLLLFQREESNISLLVSVNTTLRLLHTEQALQVFYPNKSENTFR